MLKQKSDLIRERFVILNKNRNEIHVKNKKLINFCSNDYLGLSENEKIKKAFIQGIERYGIGSGASPLVSGYFRSHQILEEKFTEFLQCEKAVLFNSGYHANVGIIRTLVKRHDTILADKYCHASLLDGMQLARSTCRRYSHNDLQHLNAMIKKTKNHKLIITESVFSMEGNLARVDEILKISQSQQINMIIDDAHGFGVLGKNGRGIIEHFNFDVNDITCLVIPLGKAMAGMGAIVAGKNEVIENIMQLSKTYCYSTALPPAIAHAMITTLTILKQEFWRREKLNSLVLFFQQEAKKRGLQLISKDLTPIQSILIGNNLLTLKIKNKLFESGFFIAAIRPPSVPIGLSRIRISLNCWHNENDIVSLLDMIAEAYAKLSD